MQVKKGRGAAFFLCVLLTAGCMGTEKYPASKVVLDDTYKLQGSDNIEFIFAKDSTLTVLQRGIYEFSENASKEPIVRICMDDISRELPEDYNFTDYLLRKEGKRIMLTFTSEEFNLDANPMALIPLKGTDGLLAGNYFEGTYQIGDNGDSYQYIFEEDGMITMRVNEHYYAEDTKMTLSDHSGSTDYLYEVSEEGLLLKNLQGDTILNLQLVGEDLSAGGK